MVNVLKFTHSREAQQLKILKIQGSLSGLCNTPINFKVNLS